MPDSDNLSTKSLKISIENYSNSVFFKMFQTLYCSISKLPMNCRTDLSIENRPAPKTKTKVTEAKQIVFSRPKGGRHKPIAPSLNHDRNSE
jgi:hypothetical protein